MPDPGRLELRHPGGATSIRVGAGALAAALDELGGWLEGRTVFLVTTPRVRALHGRAVEPLAARAARLVTIEVEEGEAAKTLDRAGELWRRMLESGGKRDSRVVGFGGGSVCDLAGFAAGAFLRGVEVALLPTTVLAQVDAAIGGKTGVNLPGAKNAVGLFHHPTSVVCDTTFLATLDPAEVRSGLLECVKMAIVLDSDLLAVLERDLERLMAADAEALAPVVASAVAAKIAVVELDPAEAGPRRILNFGHTLGHALEAVLGLGSLQPGRSLRHGEAVGWGMLFALRLAERRGRAPESAERARRMIERFALPPLPAVAPAALVAAMRKDKKAREDGIAWVLPGRLGEASLDERFDEAEIASELADFLAEAGPGAAGGR